MTSAKSLFPNMITVTGGPCEWCTAQSPQSPQSPRQAPGTHGSSCWACWKSRLSLEVPSAKGSCFTEAYVLSSGEPRDSTQDGSEGSFSPELLVDRLRAMLHPPHGSPSPPAQSCFPFSLPGVVPQRTPSRQVSISATVSREPDLRHPATY